MLEKDLARWAGRIRAAFLGGTEEQEMLSRALELRRLWKLTSLKKRKPRKGVLLSRLAGLSQICGVQNQRQTFRRPAGQGFRFNPVLYYS